MTKGSLTDTQSTSMPRLWNSSKCSTKPGRWRSEQVGREGARHREQHHLVALEQGGRVDRFHAVADALEGDFGNGVAGLDGHAGFLEDERSVGAGDGKAASKGLEMPADARIFVVMAARCRPYRKQHSRSNQCTSSTTAIGRARSRASSRSTSCSSTSSTRPTPTPPAASQWVPRVDIHEEAGRFVILADLPGIEPPARSRSRWTRAC